MILEYLFEMNDIQQKLPPKAKQGAIQSSSSPWASPVVLVEKKNGDVRFCVDYRKVNQVAKFDAYPMPRVEDVLEVVGTAKYISTLYLARGYRQVPMAEESKEKRSSQLHLACTSLMWCPLGFTRPRQPSKG